MRGAISQLIILYIPQENGVTKRKNGTLLDIIRFKMAQEAREIICLHLEKCIVDYNLYT